MHNHNSDHKSDAVYRPNNNSNNDEENILIPCQIIEESVGSDTSDYMLL